MDTPTESQREKRNSVIVRAAVSLPGCPPNERRIRNLSRSGACVEQDGSLRTGMTILLHMGTLHELAAEVVWVTDSLAGIRFAESIDLDEARKPRGVGLQAKAGWMAEMSHAYRR